MANEIRKYANWIGGLVEDNPLAAAATTLTSAGLASMPSVGSTEHMLVIFDPDGLTGAPFAKRVTAHTAAATTATIEAAAVIGTARDIPRDTPWIHGLVADDVPVVYFSQPTDATTRASTTLGALASPWQQAVTLDHAAMVVDYEVDISMQCAANEVLHAALVRGGTIIDRLPFFGSGAGDRENRVRFSGRDIPGSVGPHTYEVYIASNSGGSVTVNTSVDTSTASSLTGDGVSSMKLTKRWRTA